MTSRPRILLLAAMSTVVLPCFAQDTEVSGRSPFILVPNVRLWGADMTVGYRGLRLVPGVDTVFWAHLGGGWEGHSLFRDLSSSSLVGTPIGARDARADYNKLTFDGQIGLSQGILWSERLQRSPLEAVLLAKARFDRHYEKAGGASALLASTLRDADGIFLPSILLAVRMDGVQTVAKRQTKDGLAAEASTEWAPAGLLGSPASFVRLNAHLSGFVTLVDAPHVAVVAGDRLEGDLLLSPEGGNATIPVWARTTLGGMNPDDFAGESGLGGAVRGIASERFDGTLKLVNNLEVRLLFPEILPVAIFPGLVAYLDAGVSDFRGLDRTPTLPDDLFVSVGAGAILRALVANIVVYASYCLTPAEAAGFKVDLRFSTQF